MKLDAHPLVVAVALGLLGPGVLESEDDREEQALSDGTLRPTTGTASLHSAGEWEPGPAPDPAEFHRVELEWTASLRSAGEWLKATR